MKVAERFSLCHLQMHLPISPASPFGPDNPQVSLKAWQTPFLLLINRAREGFDEI
jgi:hypothetical protein